MVFNVYAGGVGYFSLSMQLSKMEITSWKTHFLFLADVLFPVSSFILHNLYIAQKHLFGKLPYANTQTAKTSHTVFCLYFFKFRQCLPSLSRFFLYVLGFLFCFLTSRAKFKQDAKKIEIKKRRKKSFFFFSNK